MISGRADSFHTGFTLVELLVAVAISAVLLTGIVRIAQAAAGGYRLQQALAAVQDNARFALGMIRNDVLQAGYRPGPWPGPEDVTALGPTTAEGVNAFGDRIALWRRSDRNCYGNPNPANGADGRPRFDLLVSEWSVNAAGALAQTCRYGPTIGALVTQINGLGVVDHVESFQVRYAEDTTGDGNADRWVNAGQWEDPSGIMGARFALLLASPAPAGAPPSGNLQILDVVLDPPADGRVRRVMADTAGIRSRLQ